MISIILFLYKRVIICDGGSAKMDRNKNDTVGNLTSRIAGEMKKQLSTSFKGNGYDITPEEYSILSIIWESGELHQSQIVETSKKCKTRISKIINSLVEKGYLEKKFYDKDKRNYIISSTKRSKEDRKKLIIIENTVSNSAIKSIKDEDLEVTILTLKKILGNVFKK